MNFEYLHRCYPESGDFCRRKYHKCFTGVLSEFIKNFENITRHRQNCFSLKTLASFGGEQASLVGIHVGELMAKHIGPIKSYF